MRYESDITAGLRKWNWKETLEDVNSLETYVAVLLDLRSIKSMTEAVDKYVKAVIRKRLGNRNYYEIGRYRIQVTAKEREAGLDKDAIMRDMGPQFVQKYTKPKIKYEQLDITIKES